MAVRKPYVQVLYNSKDITADVTKHLLSLSYTDKEEGESDEVELELEDVDGLWRGNWYPEKGAKLNVVLGYDLDTLNCGDFEIDEIELSGPPDTIIIKALAVGITGTLRTKKSYPHEGKTLRQIAQVVASANGLTITGTIPEVRFDRVTQNRETDLAFLKRIASEYGCLFSIRGKQLVFTTVFEIEKTKPATAVDRLDLTSYSINDKSAHTYKEAKATYHNPVNKEVVEKSFKFETSTNQDGYTYSQIASGDTKVIYAKAENKQQAELKAKAALHKANSKQQKGRISMEGRTLIVAGNNFELTGFGKVSGVYHITESRHTINRSGGYSTEASIKRVGYVEEAKQGSTKRAKANLTRKRNPKDTSVVSAKVDRLENPDNYTYTQIN